MECTACTALTTKLTAMEEECKGLRAKLTALESSDKEKAEQMTSLRTAILTATGKANDAEALGALQALKSSNERLAALEASVARERTEKLTAEFATTLDQACRDGKVTVAQRPFWDGIASAEGIEKGVAMLRGFVGTAVATTRTEPTKTPAGGTVALSADQKRTAQLLGISEADRAAFEKKLIEQGRA